MHEMSQEWYNEHIQLDPWSLPHWVKLYESAVNLLPKNLDVAIADLGCQSGFFAKVLWNKGYRNYWGVDFASNTIYNARRAVPEYMFTIGDLYSARIQGQFHNYDVFVMLEILQLLDGDLSLLEAIPPDKEVIISLPNKGGLGVVRFFLSIDQVESRYSDLVNIDYLQALPPSSKGKVFFLMHGRRKS